MNKLKFLGLAAMLTALTLFSACGAAAEPDKAPEEVVREGLSNLYSQVQSAKYEVVLDIMAEMPEGETPEKVDAKLTLTGEVDQKDPKKPKMTMKLDGSAAVDGGDSEAIGAEVRLTDTAMYMMVSKIPSMDGQIPMEMITPYLSQWYMMEIPPGTFDDPSMQTLFPGEELTEEQEKVKKLLAETDIIGDLKFEGSDDVMGMDSYHYSGKLDRDGVMEFIEGMSDIYGGQVPTEDELDEAMESLDMAIEMWIGADDMIMRKAKISMTVAPPEGGKVDMDMTYSIGNINEDMSVDIPEDVKGMEELMGLMFGAAMMMPTESDDFGGEFGDDMMMEDDMMEGMEEFDMDEFEAEMAELDAELEALEVEMEKLEDL